MTSVEIYIMITFEMKNLNDYIEQTICSVYFMQQYMLFLTVTLFSND